MHKFGHAIGLDRTVSPLTADNFFELIYKDYGQPIGGSNNILQEPSILDLYALANLQSAPQRYPDQPPRQQHSPPYRNSLLASDTLP